MLTPAVYSGFSPSSQPVWFQKNRAVASQISWLSRATRSDSVRFGFSLPANQKMNVLMIAPDYGTDGMGGLAVVMHTISEALNNPQYGKNRMDARVVVFGDQKIMENEQLNITEDKKKLVLKIYDNNGKEVEHPVYEVKVGQTTLYVITNPSLQKKKSIFSNYDPALNGNEVESVLLGKAIAQLSVMLGKDATLPQGVSLSQFNGPVHILNINDWPTNPVQVALWRMKRNKELPAGFNPAQVPIFHNEYSMVLPREDALKAKLFDNEEEYAAFMKEQGLGTEETPFHSLLATFKMADLLMACTNYVNSVILRLGKQMPLLKNILEDIQSKGRVGELHHFVLGSLNAVNNQKLSNPPNQPDQQYGFVPMRSNPDAVETTMDISKATGIRGWFIKVRVGLYERMARWFNPSPGKENGFFGRIHNFFKKRVDSLTQKAIAAFPAVRQTELVGKMNFLSYKQLNKQALQKKYGLNQDPQAVLYSYAARLDAHQKGFLTILDTIFHTDFMQKHPQAQFIIAGGANDILTEKLMAAYKKEIVRKGLTGRVVFTGPYNHNKGESMQIFAGSSFYVLPTLYEPFGLTQQEAQNMLTPVIGHPEGGLLSVVYDPVIESRKGQLINGTGTIDYYGKAIINKEHGQTGILSEYHGDVPGYQAALPRWMMAELRRLDPETARKIQTNTLIGLTYGVLVKQAQREDAVNEYLDTVWKAIVSPESLQSKLIDVFASVQSTKDSKQAFNQAQRFIKENVLNKNDGFDKLTQALPESLPGVEKGEEIIENARRQINEIREMMQADDDRKRAKLLELLGTVKEGEPPSQETRQKWLRGALALYKELKTDIDNGQVGPPIKESTAKRSESDKLQLSLREAKVAFHKRYGALTDEDNKHIKRGQEITAEAMTRGSQLYMDEQKYYEIARNGWKLQQQQSPGYWADQMYESFGKAIDIAAERVQSQQPQPAA